MNFAWIITCAFTSILLFSSVPLSTLLFATHQQSGHFSLALHRPTCLLRSSYIGAMRQEDDDHTNCKSQIPVYLLLIQCHSSSNREKEQNCNVVITATEKYMPFAQKFNKCTSAVLLLYCCWPIVSKHTWLERNNKLNGICARLFSNRLKVQKMRIDSMTENKMRLHGMCLRFVRSEEEIAWEWDTLNFMKNPCVFYVQMHFVSSIGEWKQAKGREMECVWYVVGSHLKYFNIHLLVCIICNASRLRLDFMPNQTILCSNG